jgi:hypothetical protein
LEINVFSIIPVRLWKYNEIKFEEVKMDMNNILKGIGPRVYPMGPIGGRKDRS